ncbi:F-box/LRR-repeat MAX2 homolog A [Neltuma alba]|uniref:F-box/LRR-repeat MAX2 homolog A n=1 Tax=Neltuma alba TaxID=207710 RepID=UPI0010A4FE80|nr:F-box/LRR-repeat MAX2 homolog A [Prosopis alba]
MAGTNATCLSHLPDEILTNVFAAVSDTRTRNALSLVCRSFRRLERRTRTSLTLRGNARDLHFIPNCFSYVTDLDLSLLSPWGHGLFSISSYSDPGLLAHRLRNAFPDVTSLTVYVRSATTLQLLLLVPWPELRHVKLVRWHQRPSSAPGSDFAVLFEKCKSLWSLDLSSFYHWTEDLPPVLTANPVTAASLKRLNLLTTSFSEGYKSHDIQSITAVCSNLEHLLIACTFDPRYLGYVGDEALLAVASNCPKLSLLHLVDTSSLANRRGNPLDEGYTAEDARISRTALIQLFSGLPLLEELVLDICKNVRDSSFALEVLNSKCPKLKVLKLGQFHGICLAIGSQLDGIALCQGLESLSIKNCADLTDMGLIEIARGCTRLVKFEVQGCQHITEKGLRTMACLLRKTLIDVKISCCLNLDTAASLRAIEPIRDRIERLHVDCVWNDLKATDNLGKTILAFDLNGYDDPCSSTAQVAEEFGDYFGSSDDLETSKSKRQRCDYSMEDNWSNGNGYWCNSWDRLKYLSLWIGVGELLTPLPMAGLEECPSLEEIRIRVEGDCRDRPKLTEREFGLSILTCYPQLTKMQLDCGETRGYALTAPSGQVDLSLWERFFLNGIGTLTLEELDYWPPQDEDVNQRSLSLPAAGLLRECDTLRKLFIHGTTHEHFMNFFLKISNLRDVQLREDYYPAPENDMSTEMRVASCSRFEDALNRRPIYD